VLNTATGLLAPPKKAYLDRIHPLFLVYAGV